MKHFCGLFAAWLVLLIATSVAPPIAEAAEGQGRGPYTSHSSRPGSIRPRPPGSSASS